ncbi:hypothetical protein BpHYR1_025035 [Brachionus plicatilis]|uniref:Uncharacterized protein n=1 Tax=Brachionus plicatilis TaxID=10195 RepID=A0A3M7RPQ1_BRAPC|nr:hypothetical protein BpHYR1_025035 [Brachionus plicatilis]
MCINFQHRLESYTQKLETLEEGKLKIKSAKLNIKIHFHEKKISLIRRFFLSPSLDHHYVLSNLILRERMFSMRSTENKSTGDLITQQSRNFLDANPSQQKSIYI